jgi:hypothetical protein
VALVARMMGWSRETIRQRVQQDPTLVALVAQLRRK